MTKKQLYLASSSPRRKQLMESAGYEFIVEPPSDGAECGLCSGETPPEFVGRLAWQKAKDVANRFETGLFIGADTVAECHGQILGKPENRDHAKQMLTTMSGQTHHVYTGVCLWDRPSDKCELQVVATKLVMDQLSDEQLEEYLETDGWVGKAGAFGFQDGLDWVRIQNGSESNVVGLPMEKLTEMLSKFSW